MAIDLSALANATTSATALSNLIMVTPDQNIGYQPQNKPNADGSPSTEKAPPTILFHYEGEQTVGIESDITDHFIEDNTAIQDQIALRPVTITTHGFVGELNDVIPQSLAPLKIASQKLTAISAYAPQLSVTALRAYNTAFQLYQVAQNAKNAGVASWASLNGNTRSDGSPVVQNKQQQYFTQFYGYMQSRTLFTVQTPWAVFKDMAIKSLRAIQDADTMVISDFEIQFKQMRFASTLVADLASVTYNSDGRAANQSQPLVDLGTGNTGPDLPFNVGGA